MPFKMEKHLIKLALYTWAYLFVVLSYGECSIYSNQPINLNYLVNKYRHPRFGDLENCGKRKRNVDKVRSCSRQCSSDTDCRGSKRKCLCDGECGMSCVKITTDCKRIDEFLNGVVSYLPDTYFGSKVVYECNEGYTLVGDNTRTCEGDGWWSGGYGPICQKEIFCQRPPSIQNAVANTGGNNQSKYRIGAEVEYQCEIGYSNTDESNRITCSETGLWSELNFKCTRINCGKPEDIEHGLLRGADYHYSSVVEYNCNPGYRIRNGDYLRECNLDGRWSGLRPTCEPLDCGEPPIVANAVAYYNSTRFDSKTKYHCYENYYLLPVTNSEIVCLPNGKWQDNASIRCAEKLCSLNATEYSQKMYNIFSSMQSAGSYIYPISAVLRIVCQPGYELAGATQTTCATSEANGTWTQPPPICKQEVFCPFLSPVDNVLINANKQPTPNGYSVNTTIEFSCANGYALVGPRFQVCALTNRSTGEWHGEQVFCEQETTTLPPTTMTTTTKTTMKTKETTTESTTALIVFNPRQDDPTAQDESIEDIPSTDSSHVSYMSCKIDLSSSLVSYSNIAASLQSVNELVFLNATLGAFIDHDSTVTYNCKSNALISYIAKCINGSLLLQQNCNELIKTLRSCSPPPKIHNGYNKYGSSTHGSKALYQCFNGYEIAKGNGELKCTDGEWIGPVPVCSKTNCGYPGGLTNGKVFYIGTTSEYTFQPYINTVGQNKQIRYECDKGYKLIGPNGSTCINGNWKPSSKLVKCVTDDFPKGSTAIEEKIFEINPTYYVSTMAEDDQSVEYLQSKKLLLMRDESFDNNNKEDSLVARLHQNEPNAPIKLIKTDSTKTKKIKKRLKKYKLNRRENSTKQSTFYEYSKPNKADMNQRHEKKALFS